MSERPTVLLAFTPPASLRTALEARYNVLGPMGKPFSEAVASLSDAERAAVRIVITLGSVGITRDAMRRLPALGLVDCLGTGYEAVDVPAALERHIVVAHSPGANASSVADLAIGLMIASVRNMFDASAYLHCGDWEQRGRRRAGGRGLTGRRIGIYGLGSIGAKIARRAEALEMEVGYHNRHQRNDVAYPYFPTLLALAEWAGILMISLRADASNRHTVTADVLQALGPDGHVVNIARGAVIDEAALIDALGDGTIAGAGLDVFEHEPVVPEALRKLPNVALMPHIGGDTLEAQEVTARMVLANIAAFLDDEPIPTPVPESPGSFR